MALPVGWPPRPAEGRRSIRVYSTGTTTAAFSGNAILFSQITGANTFVPTPIVPPGAEHLTVHNGNYLAGGTPSGGGAMTGQPTVSNMIWSMGIRILNTGANDLQFSFDGTNVHGVVQSGKEVIYNWRHEAGIALKSTVATTFVVEAW